MLIFDLRIRFFDCQSESSARVDWRILRDEFDRFPRRAFAHRRRVHSIPQDSDHGQCEKRCRATSSKLESINKIKLKINYYN